MPQLIARRYAQALFDLCEENKKTEIVQNDLEELLKFLKSSKELQILLQNPVISSEDRSAILTKVFREKLDESTFLYLLFLENKGRLNLIESICAAFQQIYLKAKKFLRVRITSNIELNAQQVQMICQKLQPKFQKKIHPQLRVKPEILGGLKIQIGDNIYDHTLCGQLKKFRKNLTNPTTNPTSEVG